LAYSRKKKHLSVVRAVFFSRKKVTLLVYRRITSALGVDPQTGQAAMVNQLVKEK
jgi:hypothetical protein